MYTASDIWNAQSRAQIILSALAQETRLEVFRLLSQAGHDGMGAGSIAKALGVPHNTLSTHLSILQRAGLIRSERQGRNIIYFGLQDCLTDLMAFLQDECPQAMPAGEDEMAVKEA
ncbi:Helix-turn-helix domain-containing protein [Cohaesibacter marisflavi]|uniref:Helix-turn-helix domain-containing protein n=1 Tax=Cohaesibacter marisflavi TaxID=655353 RepID=A0A1I5EET3_9HYPH|nr:metalloregulator ArsR/SmtB family transcription factor [Cohaesibacter marisflavi]SFO09965.1 Helix-turn-helix domain-containing protein [Cohaesibacter marisflavi]